MLWHSPIFTEDGSHLYRFSFLAAEELLLECRRWRNAIEEQKLSEIDLPQAEAKLEAAIRSLEIALSPPVLDGTFIDPRENPEVHNLPNVERVNVAQELSQARDGTFSALGFSGQIAHEVVYKLGQATLYSATLLRQNESKQTRKRLPAPDSPLRTEVRGLGLISAKEVNHVEAECLREAELAWRRAVQANAATTGVFVPNALQQAILKALAGRALKKQALANEVCKGDGGALYRHGDLKELRLRGLVKHKRRVGFYRPDAPPPP